MAARFVIFTTLAAAISTGHCHGRAGLRGARSLSGDDDETGTVLRYGFRVILENQYRTGSSGGWLLERDGGVSFTTDAERVRKGAAVFTVQDPKNIQRDGPAEGAIVRYGDEVVLQNDFTESGSTKYLLARHGSGRFGPSWVYKHDTVESKLKDKSLLWKVLPAPTRNAGVLGQAVQLFDDVLLEEQFQDGPYQLLGRYDKQPKFKDIPNATRGTSDHIVKYGYAVWKLQPWGVGCIVSQAVQGQWVQAGSGSTITIFQGTTRGQTEEVTRTWGVEIGATISAGMQYRGASAEVGLSLGFSYGVARSMGSYLEIQQSKSCEVSCPQERAQIWQFITEVSDVCGGAKTESCHFACSNNSLVPPCCLPGYSVDYPLYQECIEGSPNLCGEPFTAAGGKLLRI